MSKCGLLLALMPIVLGIGITMGRHIEAGSWPWSEVARARRSREKELHARMVIYLNAGMSEYTARDEAERDMTREARGILKELPPL